MRMNKKVGFKDIPQYRNTKKKKKKIVKAYYSIFIIL